MVFGLENLLKKGKRFLRNSLIYASVPVMIACASGGNGEGSGKSGSGDDGADNENPQEDYNPEQEKTERHIFDGESLGKISSYDPASGKIVFSEPMDLYSGNILFAIMSDKTPDGLLRIVTGVSEDKKSVDTRQATIPEGFGDGIFYFPGIKNSLRENSLTPLQAQAVQNSLEILNFDLSKDNLVLYDADGKVETTYDQMLANLDLSCNSDFTLRFEVGDGKINSLKFENISGCDSNVELSVLNSLKGISVEKTIAEKNFSPFTVYFPTPFGLLPLVFRPKAEGIAFASGSVSPIKTSVSNSASFTAGLEYNSGSLSPISSYSNSFGFVPPSVPKISDLKGGIGLKLSLLLYGIIGPNARANAYLGVNANDSSWQLSAGLEGIVGIKGEIFGKSLGDISAKVIDYSKVLADGIKPTIETIIQPGLTDGKDAYVRWSNLSTAYENTNYGGQTLLDVIAGSGLQRESLIQFPLSSIPNGSDIVSANLNLHGYCVRSIASPITVNIRKILNSWNELTVTWATKPSYDSINASTLDVPDSGTNNWHEWNLTSLVQNWIDGTPNNGVILILGDPSSDCHFKSSEYSDAILRPKLVISYRP